MKFKSLYILTIIIAIFAYSCGGNQIKNRRSVDQTLNEIGAYKTPDKYNLKLIIYDTNISNPDDDKHSFYKIFIDKSEAGRTTSGLETQKKYFESNLSVNRHLLKIEKYVLDPKKNEYIRLNNIHQPKPDFYYFEIIDNRITVLDIENDVINRTTEYNTDYEK